MLQHCLSRIGRNENNFLPKYNPNLVQLYVVKKEKIVVLSVYSGLDSRSFHFTENSSNSSFRAETQSGTDLS